MIRRFRVVVVPLAAGVCLVIPPRSATAQQVTPPPVSKPASSAAPADRQASLAILKSWVTFPAGSATLGGLAQSVLDNKADILELNPSLKIRIHATGRDAADGRAAALTSRRVEAVRAYLISHGAEPSQIVVVTAATSDTRIGAGFDIEVTPSEVPTTVNAITALKQTRTVVRTRPGLEVFTLPRNLANDSVRILCSPPLAARFGVADTSGVVSGALLPKALVFVARDGARVFTLHHDVSLVADPDRVDMTTQSPDPRCK